MTKQTKTIDLGSIFVQKSQVKNNLSSTDTDKPLSAYQGKVLDEKIDNVVAGNIDLSSTHIHNTHGQTEIERNTDLNDSTYAEPGWYYTRNNEISTTIGHTPWVQNNDTSNARSFAMEVIKTYGWIQILYSFNTNDVWYRRNSKNTIDSPSWSQWIKFYNNQNLTVNDIQGLDQIQGNVYTADDTTLSLSNSNQFSVKDGGITSKKIENFYGEGDSGDSGYLKIMKITVSRTYLDTPLKFEIYGRHSEQPTYCYLQFNGGNTTDPTLKSFIIKGENRNVYAYKETTSTWSILVEKETSGRIYVTNITKSKFDTSTIEGLNSLIDEVPNTAIQATYIDFTSEEKTKLNNIEASANNYTHPSTHNATMIIDDNANNYTAISSGLTNSSNQKVINTAINDKINNINSHIHGNITNDGKVGSTANKPLITTTNGAITTGSFGTTANSFCQGNDSRLSDARTPKTTQIIATSNDDKKDLNDYVNIGFYYCLSNNHSPYIIHCPNSDGTSTPYTGNKAFYLLVETFGNSTTYIKQTLTYYGDNKTYIRTRAADGWGAWKEISKDTTYTPANAISPVNVYTGSIGTSTNYARQDHSHTTINTTCDGNNSTDTYLKLATFTITTTYQDRPINFDVMTRKGKLYHVVFSFMNGNTTDPQLHSFVVSGDGQASFYMVKESTSTWSLIINKIEAYDSVHISNLQYGKTINITYPNTSLSTLPTTNIMEALYIKDNVGTNLIPDTKKFTTHLGQTSTVTGETYNGCVVRKFQNNPSSGDYQEFRWTIPKELLNHNDIFTFSFWAKSDLNHGYVMTYFWQGNVNSKRLKSNGVIGQWGEGDGFNQGGTQFYIGSDWNRYYVTYQLDSNGTFGDKSFAIRLTKNTTADNNLYVCGVKLERGDQATPYSENPIDSLNLTANKNIVSDSNGNLTTEDKPVIDNSLSSSSTNAVQNKVINTALTGKANSSHTHADNDIKYTSNATADVSALDMAMSENLNANRLAFLPASNITIRYSTTGADANASSGWIDYGSTDDTKVRFVTTSDQMNYVTHTTGKNATASSNNRLQVILDAGYDTTNGSNLYTIIRKLLILVHSNGSSNCKCQVDTAMYSAPTNWTTRGTYSFVASGRWNSIPMPYVYFGGPASAMSSNNIRYIRLTFYTTDNVNIHISGLKLLGDSIWNAPSNLARLGHIYSYDKNQNAIFPNKILFDNNSTTGETGNGVWSGALTSDESNITTYLGKKISFNGSINQSNTWYNVISTRHKNGGGADGYKYGMYLRSKFGTTDNLTWNQQNNSTWGTERTILDSRNTSFTRNLSSGTKIGSIKINDTSTDIYCEKYTADNSTLELSSNQFKVKDSGITTAKIANEAITGAKIAAGTITADRIQDGAITTTNIGDGKVTTSKIADSNITTAKIADGNISTVKIANSAVTSAKIADNNVTTAKIADSNVTTAKIANSAVTTAKIANSNVTTDKIANSAVTSDKIANETIVNADISLNAGIEYSKLSGVAASEHTHGWKWYGGTNLYNASPINSGGNSDMLLYASYNDDIKMVRLVFQTDTGGTNATRGGGTIRNDSNDNFDCTKFIPQKSIYFRVRWDHNIFLRITNDGTVTLYNPEKIDVSCAGEITYSYAK